MYRRDELSNSKFADAVIFPENQGKSTDFVSPAARDIDTTFLREWGFLFGLTMHGHFLWTAESFDSGSQYAVRVQERTVLAREKETRMGGIVLCRDD